MKHDPIIYMIKNKNNGKMYFGQTVNFQRRMNEYKNRRSEGSSKYHIMEVLDNEGRENFEFSIVEHCSKDELNERESYYIKKHNTINPLFGYNSQKGETDKRMFKRTREKMHLSHLGVKESSVTKKKKSKAILAISLKNNLVYYADSTKLFAEKMGFLKETIRKANRKMRTYRDLYIVFYNINDRKKFLKNKVIVDTGYKKALNISKESLETIEKHYIL